MTRTPEEVGRYVRDRRLALGRTQVDVIDAARDEAGNTTISEPTMRAVEKGRTAASDLTLAAISRGLDWPPDHLRRYRDGQLDPDHEPEPLALAGLEGAEKLNDEQRAKVEAYIRGLLES